jgi:hypothetical protein
MCSTVPGASDVGCRFHVLRSRTRFRRCRGRRVPFSCFALPDSFSTFLRASGPVFLLCAPGHVFNSTEGVRCRFHVLRCLTRFRCTVDVGSYFEILRSLTHFRRYRRRPLPFSCFALTDKFSASGPIFMFCAPELIYDCTEGVWSCFHVLRSRTRFRRFRGRRVPFTRFASPNSLSAVWRVSCPVFMFCALGLVFGISDGVGSRFHVLRPRTRFRRYRGRRVRFSCFVLPYLFSAKPRASGPVFMFCAPELIFGGIDGVRSSFDILRSQTYFRRCGGRRVPFSCFALLDTYSAVRGASGPVFMFCSPGHVFGGSEGVGSRFHVFRSRTRLRHFGWRWVPFLCFASP